MKMRRLILESAVVFMVFQQAQCSFITSFPSFPIRPKVKHKALGESVSFSCQGEGTDVEIYWKFRGHRIEGHDQIRVTTAMLQSTLSITKVTSELEGGYCCCLFNGYREWESCGALKIKRAPKGILDPVSRSVIVGGFVNFTCVVTAHPTPTIAWIHNGSIICREGTNKYCTLASTNHATHSGILEVSDIQHSDAGLYQCNATNSLGSSFSGIARLDVRDIDRTTTTATPASQIIISTSTDPSAPILHSSIVMNSVHSLRNITAYSVTSLLEEHYVTKPANSHSTILIVVFLGITLIVILTLCIFYLKRFDKLHRRTEKIAKRHVTLQGQQQEDKYVTMHKLRYPIDQLNIIQELGEGVFGLVYKARAPGLLAPHETATVAVKMIRASDQNKSSKVEDFKREAELLATFRHQNIIQLLGICFEYESPTEEQTISCLLFEYMEGGDLCVYLRNHGPNRAFFNGSVNSEDEFAEITEKDKLTICSHIACGMAYLAERNFIHRDLATRNCLISGRDCNIKIADFGLSRRTYESDYYKAGDTESVPIRWMSPEAILYGKYSSQSDVWAFGVTLWEIYTYALQPYFSLSNEEVICCICQGKILSPPSDAPEWMFSLMQLCWQHNPEDRPDFATIHSVLQAISFNGGELPLSEVNLPSYIHSTISPTVTAASTEPLMNYIPRAFNIPPPKEFIENSSEFGTCSPSTDLGVSSLTTNASFETSMGTAVQKLLQGRQVVRDDAMDNCIGQFDTNYRSDSCLPDSPSTIPSTGINSGSAKESVI